MENAGKETTSNDESDDQNKQYSQSYDNLTYFSDKQKVISEDAPHDIYTKIALPNNLNDFTESPRSRLARFVPDSPFKINAIPKDLCDSKVFVRPGDGNKSFHISLSVEAEDSDSNDHTYSKSCDCSEDIIESLHQHVPITRSVSEDFLQRPTTVFDRRISVVSSSKGRLAAVTRVHPKEKLTRTPSIGGAQPTPQTPSRISQDEAELLTKTPFTREKKYVAICLCLVDFTAFLSMSIIAPFFPREASGKGMREAVSGFVFSIYALIIMLASPIFGKLLPSVGAKFMFLSGVGFCGACNVLFGLLDKVNGTMEFTVLCFIVRSFEAIGAAAFCTASCTILIDQFPDHIGTVFGFVETSLGIGMSLGPAIGGALYAAGGFGLPFFTLGGCVVAIVPVCWFLLRNTEDPKNIINSNNTVSYKKLLSMPHVIVVCLILAVSSQAQAFVDPTLEPHMRQYDLDASIIGVLFLLLSACYGVASPIVGWLSGKVENKYPIMIIGLFFVTASILLLGPSNYLPISGSVWLSTVALALLGFSLALAYIPTFESIFIAAMNGGLEDDINTYSVVSGLWNSVYSLGEVTGPSLGGVLSDFFTFPQASTLMAFCTLAAFFVAIIAWYNPSRCFGMYNLIEDAPEKMALSQNAQVNNFVPSRECTPLQNGCVHTYGSLAEDKRDPLV